MKTYLATNKDVKRIWYIVDAKDKILGRLATAVAGTLKGKHKTMITPHIDCGDGVIVINARDVKVTGKKMLEKLYGQYSGYPGGLNQKKMDTMMKLKPAQVVRVAIKGMLPKTKLGRQMIKRLKVYEDNKHPHESQEPKELKF